MGPRYLLQLLLMLGLVAACSTKSNGPAQPVTPSGPSFALSVEAPPEVKVGGESAPSIRVVPRGGYKVNMEYPTKLQVKAPAGVSPAEETLPKAKAARHTEGEILFKPAFKLESAGEHAFQGTLRFSVCTKQQCEIKSETVKWTAKAKAE